MNKQFWCTLKVSLFMLRQQRGEQTVFASPFSSCSRRAFPLWLDSFSAVTQQLPKAFDSDINENCKTRQKTRVLRKPKLESCES